MTKVLYVDIPFEAESNQGAERSRFIWDILSRAFITDLLLLKTPEYLTRKVPDFQGYEQLHSLATAPPNPLKTKSIYQFSRDNLDKFCRILQTGKYNLVFFRGEACLELADEAAGTLPDCHIVLDIEKPISRHELLLWKQNPRRQNLAHQLEYISMQMLEKNLFRQPYTFFLAAPSQVRAALQISGLKAEEADFRLLANPLDFSVSNLITTDVEAKESALLKDKFILFYGDLANENNLDAFQFLTKEIYARISKVLQEKDVKVYIVGKNAQPVHEHLTGGRIKLIGEVKEISNYLKSALLIVLPLRKSASLHRITEAALWSKAVVTTAAGASELELSSSELALENSADGIAAKITQLLKDPLAALELGEKLNSKLREKHDKINTERKFLQDLHDVLSKPAQTAAGVLQIAIVTEAYGEEAGRIGSHVYQLVQKLIPECKVTVLCPGQGGESLQQHDDNLRILHFADFRAGGGQKPLSRSKTLCSGIFSHLLRHNYDIIQCYPGFSPNGTLAFLAGKIREIPVVMNVFEIAAVDAEQPASFKEAGISYLKKALLRNADYIFTVCEKDYKKLNRLNPRVEQIPLPIKPVSVAEPVQSVRSRFNIPESDFLFVCLGRITRQKGQDLAVKAFARALPALPQARLVLVGSTTYDSEFYEELELLISREGLQGDVLFTDEVKREEALAWLQAADLQIVPARHMQAGNVVIEGWMCGTPVLQSDAVDPNLVNEDCNGYLFRSEDVEDLAQQMLKAYKNRQRLTELAGQGRELVNTKYTFSYLASRYLAAYKQLTL